MSDIRQSGTVLFYVNAPDGQQRARRSDIVQGVLQADNGWIYAWRLGHSYRDCTTPDKLQPGCRVSFEVMPDQPWFATNLSYRGVDKIESPIRLAIDLQRTINALNSAHMETAHVNDQRTDD